MLLANIMKRLRVEGISSSNEEATIQFDLRANASLPVDCHPTRNNPTASAQADGLSAGTYDMRALYSGIHR
jgi:hypothetical protein